MTFVYPFPPIPMASFPFPFPALRNLRLYSNFHLFPKSNPDSLPFPFPLKQEEFQKTLIEEWFSLEWANKIIHYYSTQVHINEVKMTCSGEGLANVLLKWLCFQVHILLNTISLWYVEKLQWEFIPIPIALFPFSYFYSHSHSHYHDIIIVTLIPVGIPWDLWEPNCSHFHAHLYSAAYVAYGWTDHQCLLHIHLYALLRFSKF